MIGIFQVGVCDWYFSGRCVCDWCFSDQCVCDWYFSGRCVCDEPFIGVDCSVDTQTAPVITRLAHGGLCNSRVSDCRSVSVYGHTFVQGRQLRCYYRKIEVRNSLFLFFFIFFQLTLLPQKQQQIWWCQGINSLFNVIIIVCTYILSISA